MTRPVFVYALAAALALLLATSTDAAAPRLIMVSGEPLADPILVSTAEEAFELYESFYEGRPVERSRLEGRPSLRLGFFWDNALWEPYVRAGRLGELKPEQANQVGQFYPAVGREPAAVDIPAVGKWPKMASATTLRMFEARGVPVRLDEDEADSVPWIAAGLVGGAVLAVALLLLARRLRTTRSSAVPASH
jgi:hypothetical protein